MSSSGKTRPQEAQRAPQAASRTVTFPQLAALTQALMACEKMQIPDGRDLILEQVRAEIASVVPRQNDTKSDVMAMIRTASNYPGGLEEPAHRRSSTSRAPHRRGAASRT
jgi:hypothetical protein